MRRRRAADRLQDALVVVLVAAAMGFAATAPHAASDAAWGEVTVVDAPAVTACAATDVQHRQACLSAAAAIALRR